MSYDGIVTNIEIPDGKKLQINDERVGNLASLETEVKNSIVGSINSLLQELGTSLNGVINSLASAGVLLGSANVVRVSVGGAAPYVSLKTAIDNAQNLPVPTIILLEPGTYNIVGLFPKASYSSGMVIPNNVYLVGNGQREQVILSAELGSDDAAYSPVNMTKNCGIANLTVKATNCRYCVHDDASEDGAYTRIVENVVLRGSSNALRWAYGAGIRNGNTLKLKSVKFINDNGCFSIHSWVGSTETTHIELVDCDFFQYAIGDNPYDCILSAMNIRDGVTSHGDVLVDMKNCNAKTVIFNYDAGFSNYFQVNCDNPYTLLVTGYDTSKLVKAGVVRCLTTQALTKGTLVTFTNFSNKCQAFEPSYTKAFADGVTITDKDPNTGEVLVAIKGNIDGGVIGIPVQPSKFLNYDSTTDALVVENTEGAVPVAYGGANSCWRLVL